MAPKKTVSSARVSEAGEKAIDKLDVKEFRERFCIPNDVSIDLVNEEAAMPTEKGEENVILFTKEQFNAGLRFPLPALFKEFLHFSQFHPSSFIPTLSGKQKMISSVCPRTCPPFNGDRAARFDKGRGEGAGGGPGWMGGLSERASGIEGPPCGLGGKGVLRLCLQIIRDRSQGEAYKTLLSARNLIAVVAESQEYLKRLMLRDGESSWRIEIRGKNEGTIRKAPGQKRGPDSPSKESSSKKEEAGEEEWEGCEGTHSSQGRPRTHVGVESIRSFLGLGARLANVAEEAASINRPGNLNPDADAAETAPLEEAGAESQSQPSDDPDRLAIVLVKGPPQEAAFDARSTSGLFGGFKSGSKRLKLAALLPMTLIMDGGEVEMALRPQPPRQ
ncbi:hypothetical protein CK203_082439 [Vitis vinifera]|uniref:Uncharacterized protein n=1 Tax=Vitis vinifera TaxID=29760 RepID=A0A438BNS3_VITVI|nr:hypothetical protein CK203_082439 [Vitis vinifera]